MIDSKVRRWILSRPGVLTAKTPGTVIEQALEKCSEFAGGLTCSIEEFTAALWRAGYAVNQVRQDDFRLCLPTPEFEPPRHP